MAATIGGYTLSLAVQSKTATSITFALNFTMKSGWSIQASAWGSYIECNGSKIYVGEPTVTGTCTIGTATFTGLQPGKTYSAYGYSGFQYPGALDCSGSGTTNEPTACTSSVSVATTRTSATATMKITVNPDNAWRIHWYELSTRNWVDCSGFTTGTWTYNISSSLSPNTSYNFYTQLGCAGDTYLQGQKATAFKTTANAPTLNGVNVATSRTAATISVSSASYDTNCAYDSLYYCTSTNGTYTRGTTIGSLTANKSYTYYVKLRDTAGNYSGYKTINFTTTGNNPTASNLAVSNIGRTSATVSISGSYDTNASFSSWELQYGTSTNYGTTLTNGNLQNLTPNTTYYIRGRVKDNWNRWSSWITNSFTTTGNAPTIDSVDPDIFRTKAILDYSASYDTNDSYKNLSIKYGTSTSYGSTSTSTTLSGLQPNTTYYYSMTVTSNKNRTSSAKTGSFKTTAYLPSGLSISASGTLPFTTNLHVTGMGDTNAGITNYTYYYRTKPIKETYDMPLKTMSDGSTWARIFYHNNKNASVLFNSLAECRNTQTTDKYSRLYLLEDDTYKRDGKFEFMICYPIDAPGKYNRWKQTNAPQSEYNVSTTSGTKVAGYEAIHTDFTSNYFGGLELYSSDTTTLGSTWLDGSCGHGNWFYAIGTSVEYGRGIPSASDIGDSTADVVEIWVRIDDATVTSQSMGTSTSVVASGLAEETEYIFFMSATNAAGTNYSSAIPVITLADQAKIRIKKDGTWIQGKTYFKKDGQWVKVKKVYRKIDGQWKIGHND